MIIGQGFPVSNNDEQNFTMPDSRSQKQVTTRHRTNSRVQVQRGHGVILETNVVTGAGHICDVMPDRQRGLATPPIDRPSVPLPFHGWALPQLPPFQWACARTLGSRQCSPLGLPILAGGIGPLPRGKMPRYGCVAVRGGHTGSTPFRPLVGFHPSGCFPNHSLWQYPAQAVRCCVACYHPATWSPMRQYPSPARQQAADVHPGFQLPRAMGGLGPGGSSQRSDPENNCTKSHNCRLSYNSMYNVPYNPRFCHRSGKPHLLIYRFPYNK